MLLSSFCDMFQPDKKQHASYTNFLCNIFTLSKGNMSSISLWISSRLFVRNLHWWNKSSLNYQKIDLKSYKSLAWLKRRIQWERKNRKRSSPVLKEELIARYNVGCETSRSVDVCESNQVTLEPCWVCLRVSFSDYATDLGSKIYFI